MLMTSSTSLKLIKEMVVFGVSFVSAMQTKARVTVTMNFSEKQSEFFFVDNSPTGAFDLFLTCTSGKSSHLLISEETKISSEARKFPFRLASDFFSRKCNFPLASRRSKQFTP